MLGPLEITPGYAGDIRFEQVDQMDQAASADSTIV